MSLTKSKEAQILAPEDCTEMAHVRAGIDALDKELVTLIARRTLYIEAAARIKPSLDNVRVPWRIEDVVAKVVEEARKQGLSATLTESVWRELIEKSIQHEAETWVALREGSSE